MEKIQISVVNDSSYYVYSRDTLDDLFSMLKQEEEVVVIIDKNVEAIYGHLIPYRKVIIDVSEEKKNIETVVYIIDELLKMEVTRKCLIIGVGGGVTTDISGFVASIFKRGVRFAYVPTSLVGQIDASIGGKTGINFTGYKNVIGTINQPQFSYVNTSLLRTLPVRDVVSGVAEMLKTFIIADAESYQRAVVLFKDKSILSDTKVTDEQYRIFQELVARAIEIKCSIVQKDIRDQGERYKLNLGHTFGHALEKYEDNSQMPNHGESVAIGIIISAKISERLMYLRSGVVKRLKRDFESIGLPFETILPEHKLIPAIRNDKKREGNSINFVLIKDIGSVIVEKITIEKLEKITYDLY